MVYKTYSSNKSIRGATPHKNFIQDDIEKQVQKILRDKLKNIDIMINQSILKISEQYYKRSMENLAKQSISNIKGEFGNSSSQIITSFATQIIKSIGNF